MPGIFLFLSYLLSLPVHVECVLMHEYQWALIDFTRKLFDNHFAFFLLGPNDSGPTGVRRNRKNYTRNRRTSLFHWENGCGTSPSYSRENPTTQSKIIAINERSISQCFAIRNVWKISELVLINTKEVMKLFGITNDTKNMFAPPTEPCQEKG